MGKDSPSPPPPPDYAKAAAAMRTNQVTPFGSSIWSDPAPMTTGAFGTAPNAARPPGQVGNMLPGRTWNNAPQTAPNTNQPQSLTGTQYQAGGPGGASEFGSGLGTTSQFTPGTPSQVSTNTTTLTPDLQKGLEGITGRVAQNMSQGPDLSSVPQIADKAYGALTSRLDPQWAQNTSSQETALRNQGLVPGGEAYGNAMRVFNQAKNDAYQQANLGAISTMPQTYQLATDQYNQPLNQLNAIRSGAQIQGPQFEGSPNYLGAAQAQGQYGQGLYNAEVGSQNAMTSGLFGLGGAGIMAYAL